MINYTANTDKGKKYDHNEDCYFLPKPDDKFKITEDVISAKGDLFIVCDGMGGAKSGEVASQLTCGWVAADFYTQQSDIKTIISETNTKIFNLAGEHEQYNGMCTTIVAAHIADNTVSICSVGDSRAYLLRDNKLEQLTEDQSAIWALYKDGSITKEELRVHPRSHVLLRAIGSDEILDKKDIFTCEKELKKKDILILCSDGLSDMVSDAEIQGVLIGSGSIDEKAEQLVDMANENGGRDNITVVLVEI